MTKIIALTQGKVTQVDDGDFDYLNQLVWHACKHRNTWYALHSTSQKATIRMHRMIMNAPKGVQVDHKNGNGLDNRKKNLRFATHAGNMQNSRKPKNNTSGFKGVYYNKSRKVFQAYIMVNRKHIYLGAFSIPEEAARAYDKAAKKHHGLFARLNFPFWKR